VRAFTLDQAKGFWERQKKQPWTLAVCGNFEREAILALAGNLPDASAPAAAAPPPVWTTQKELALRLAGRNQEHLMLVFPTVALDDPDAPGLNLLQAALSGMSGLLFTELRDKQGLGYSVTAMPWNAKKAGFLLFYIATDPGQAEQARQGFIKVVEDLRARELPEEILERSKNSIRGEYYRSKQSLRSRSAEAATMSVLGLPLDLPERQIQAAAAITPAELRGLALKYLNLEKAYWLEVRP
jgi:zinc protease